jgi:hypothetical protein
MSGGGFQGPEHKEGDNLWSGEGTESPAPSTSALADLFYRAEGAVEGGVPRARSRRRRDDAGDAAASFSVGGVDGGVDAVFEGGIIGAGMDATQAMITSATMAQADRAMDALGQTSRIAKRDGRQMFQEQCISAAVQQAEGYCATPRARRPDGRPAASFEECVGSWLYGTDEMASTEGMQLETSTTQGAAESEGGKRTDSVKGGGDLKVVKAEGEVGGEKNWGKSETWQSGARQSTSGSSTRTTGARQSPVDKCFDDAAERYGALFGGQY